MGSVPSSHPVIERKSPYWTFCENLHKIGILAFLSVPGETLTIKRIDFVKEFPNKKCPPYVEVIREIGIKGLWKGWDARIAYSVAGNFATVWGMQQFGDGFAGMTMTSVVKNILLPLSLLSTSRQRGDKKWKVIRKFVWDGVTSKTAHLGFFQRNLLANYCLVPAFWVRDTCYQKLGDGSERIAMTTSFITALGLSVLMNSFLKPSFTGVKDLEEALFLGKKFIGKGSLTAREFLSLLIIWLNTFPKKSEDPPQKQQKSSP